MTNLWQRVALGFVWTLSLNAYSAGLFLRAVNKTTSAEVVRFIAQNTAPTRLDPANFNVDSRMTPIEIIERICGSIPSGYYDAFLYANQLSSFSSDKPIGEAAKTLVWPSCLYVKPLEKGLSTVVAKDESASSIYTRLTGGHGRPAQLSAFFGRPVAQLAKLMPGDVLIADHVTAPVEVTPVGIDADEFTAKLKELADSDAGTKVRSVESAVGKIILPVGQIASAPAPCVDSGHPFDTSQVLSALTLAREKRKALGIFPAQADVVIVDNGFFGADPNTHPDAPFVGSPFDERFFKQTPRGTIARPITIGEIIWPINKRDGTPITADRGHGTHVAGLALGGPEFADVRRESSSIDIWEQLTILNVSDGEPTVVPGAETSLHQFISLPDTRRIVNMSIAYDGVASPDISGAFESLLEAGKTTLFVVAAGNQAEDVSDAAVYPAALGGPNALNVLTVAATGGDNHLANFSNYGSDAVDLAAPGCEIESWLDNTLEESPLTGTSQAAPIVTFAASLLRSLEQEIPPEIIKARLIASGDLLPMPDRDKTAYGVYLDLPKALFWFDDYVSIAGSQGGSYLGTVTQLPQIRCSKDHDRRPATLETIWSVKRVEDHFLFFPRSDIPPGAVKPPCDAKVGGDELRFTPEYRVDSYGLTKLPASTEMVLPISDLQEIVMRTRLPE